MSFILIGLSLMLTSCSARPAPSRDFLYHEILDENYELYWDFNDTDITFEVNVRTNGFVGFGISPKGGMAGSDVVIGWVKDGQPHFMDRHAVGNSIPIIDSSQDWFLIQGKEEGNYTVLTFVRKLETCDDEDKPILKGTTKVIYSYHPDDPADDNSIMYHGPNRRGTKSLLLLDPPSTALTHEDLPDNLITFDFLNENYTVPSKDTTYHRVLIKIPDLGEKHHVIRYEPVIQKGHERLVHHMVLSYCNGNIDEKYVGDSWEYTAGSYYNHPVESQCSSVFLAWAVGGTAFDYPLNVGHSLGMPKDPKYFSMETHYDNPGLRDDFVDNSGFRIYMTTELRQYDAGVIEAGAVITANQIIPPFEPNFLSSSHCSEDCISRGLGDQEVKVFATLLHAHLLGVKLRARHFRNGTELKPLQEDNNYDFNFQEMRVMEQETILKKGDSLMVECEYDSTGRSNVTFGGLSTRNEMCIAFIWYYPKVPLDFCLSGMEYRVPPEYAGYDIYGLIKQYDWTKQEDREKFKEIVKNSDYGTLCHGDSPEMNEWKLATVPKPNITDHYQSLSSSCSAS